MAREIKFRVWDNQENKYFEPIYEAYKGNLLDLSISLSGRLLRRTIKFPAEDQSNFENRYVLEQITGLKDKNGKEIYEGDIVKGIFYSENIGVVRWLDKRCGFYVIANTAATDIVNRKPFESAFKMNSCKLEVIGNIYEKKNF